MTGLSSHQIARTLKHSIGFKLTLTVSLVLFTVFTGKATYDGITNYSHEIAEHTVLTAEENRVLASDLETVFAAAYQSLLDTGAMIEYELSLPIDRRDRNRVINYITFLLEKNPALDGLGVFFEPDAFDGRDAFFANKDFYDAAGRFIPYADKLPDRIVIDSVDNIDGEAAQEWYVRPRTEKRILLIPPFKYENTVLTTYALPIIHDGKAIGVVNADIDVTFLQEMVASFPNTSKESFKVVYSNTGIVVANGLDASDILNNDLDTRPEFRQHFAAVETTGLSETVLTSRTSGEQSKFIFVNVNVPGVKENWLFVSIDSINSFTASARRNLIITVIVYIIILISVIILLFLLITHTISRPLQATALALKDIAEGEGDLTVRLPVRGSDEIAELSSYFNQTIMKIATVIQSVGENTAVMQEIGNVLASNMTETASAVHQINANIEGVKQETFTQSAGVTETAATVEEIIERLDS